MKSVNQKPSPKEQIIDSKRSGRKPPRQVNKSQASRVKDPNATVENGATTEQSGRSSNLSGKRKSMKNAPSGTDLRLIQSEDNLPRSNSGSKNNLSGKKNNSARNNSGRKNALGKIPAACEPSADAQIISSDETCAGKSGRKKDKKGAVPPATKPRDVSKKTLNARKQRDVTIRQMYNKAKHKLIKPTRGEGVLCPDEISQQIDVLDEYEGGAEPVEPKIDTPVNNENNGHLFIKGVPFWATKDEKPPQVNYVGTSQMLKDIMDRKLVLLKDLKAPPNLDPFHEMSMLTSRDKEYYDPHRLITNTIKSLVGSNTVPPTRSTVTASPGPKKDHNMVFENPTVMNVYNRKNREDKINQVKFVPGALAKKKNGIFKNWFF